MAHGDLMLATISLAGAHAPSIAFSRRAATVDPDSRRAIRRSTAGASTRPATAHADSTPNVDELARARRVQDLDTAAVLPDPRAERRRRLAEPDLEFRAFWARP